MPGEAVPVCRRPPVTQISTGQAGAEVNRDLEVLFAEVNAIKRCIARVADFADGATGGAFAGGSGSSGTGVNMGNSGTGGESALQMPVYRITTGSNFTVPDGFTGVVMVVPSANIDVTLCNPIAEHPITIVHAGSKASGFVVTVKDNSGTTIDTMLPTGQMHLLVGEDDTNAPAWPTAALVSYLSGVWVITGNFYMNTNTGGLYLKSPDGTYWQLTADNTGAVVTTSAGASIPV